MTTTHAINTLTAQLIADRFRLYLIETLRKLVRKSHPMSDHDAYGKVMDLLNDIDAVNRLNGLDAPVCASHDHCDANMPMGEAFARVMGREMEASSPSDAALWRQAWAIAKAEGFHPARACKAGN